MDFFISDSFAKEEIPVTRKSLPNGFQIIFKDNGAILNYYPTTKNIHWQGKEISEKQKEEYKNIFYSFLNKWNSEEKMEIEIPSIKEDPFQGMISMSEEEATKNVNPEAFWKEWYQLQSIFKEKKQEFQNKHMGPWIAIDVNGIYEAKTEEELTKELHSRTAQVTYIGNVDKDWIPKSQEILIMQGTTDISGRPHFVGRIRHPTIQNAFIEIQFLLDTGSEAALCLKRTTFSLFKITGKSTTNSQGGIDSEEPSIDVDFSFPNSTRLHTVRAICNYLDKPLIGMPIICQYKLVLPQLISGQQPTLE